MITMMYKTRPVHTNKHDLASDTMRILFFFLFIFALLFSLLGSCSSFVVHARSRSVLFLFLFSGLFCEHSHPDIGAFLLASYYRY